MESISGHLSRRMLEHHSHVRLDAKRKALDELDVWRERLADQRGSDPIVHLGMSYVTKNVTNGDGLC
jgi:hypothetical protein